MKQVLISIYDNKTKLYSPPVLFESMAAAKRTYTQVVNSKDKPITEIAVNPNDFDMMLVGHFDRNNGQVFTSQPVKNLCNLGEFVDTKTVISDLGQCGMNLKEIKRILEVFIEEGEFLTRQYMDIMADKGEAELSAEYKDFISGKKQGVGDAEGKK